MATKKTSGKQAPRNPNAAQLVLKNRKARHDYEILDTFEAGLVLSGSEVKSLREHNVQWGDAHARLDDHGELWLYGLHIGEYRQAGHFNHEPTSRRKLLLHRHEINRLEGKMQAKGLTIIPLALLFRRGWAKCEIAVCRGKAKADKRKDMRKREAQRDVERELARRRR